MRSDEYIIVVLTLLATTRTFMMINLIIKMRLGKFHHFSITWFKRKITAAFTTLWENQNLLTGDIEYTLPTNIFNKITANWHGNSSTQCRGHHICHKFGPVHWGNPDGGHRMNGWPRGTYWGMKNAIYQNSERMKVSKSPIKEKQNKYG